VVAGLDRKLAACALFLFFLASIAGDNFVDPDAFHGMALAREALAQGRIPLRDSFAYTPTLFPVVHHEWGTGLLLWLSTRALGAGGILAWKYGLAAAIAACLAALYRRSGTPVAVVAALAPAGILLLASGFSAVRAQVFTLLGTALLLLALERDRRGDRGWILPWLAVHAVWLNLHAGFAAGALLFLLYAVEQALRGARIRHLLATLAAMAVLVLLNPYGWRYVPALARGLALDRSIVTEWDPIWRDDSGVLLAFAAAMLASAYAFARNGWRRSPGFLLVGASAAAAILHQRHASIFAVVWLGCAPAWFRSTPAGEAIVVAWGRRVKRAAALSALAAAGCAAVLAARAPWRLRVPANPGEHALLLYPEGAVRYLDEQGFRGNLMTPFTVGAYVAWHLHPRVRVSFDGRLEAAYPPDAARENRDFYAAREGWRETLAKYPTDAVLVRCTAPVAARLAEVEGWTLDYRDDAYEVFGRSGLPLAPVDRRGVRIEASFP
jgi:hypothetical protein